VGTLGTKSSSPGWTLRTFGSPLRPDGLPLALAGLLQGMFRPQNVVRHDCPPGVVAGPGARDDGGRRRLVAVRPHVPRHALRAPRPDHRRERGPARGRVAFRSRRSAFGKPRGPQDAAPRIGRRLQLVDRRPPRRDGPAALGLPDRASRQPGPRRAVPADLREPPDPRRRLRARPDPADEARPDVPAWRPRRDAHARGRGTRRADLQAGGGRPLAH